MRLLFIAAACLILTAAPARSEEPEFEGHDAAHWVDRLEKGELRDRRKAAWALWHLAPTSDRAVAATARALADRDAYVRDTSAKTLVKLADAAKAAMPVLATHLSAEQDETRHAAAFTIFRLGNLAAGIVPQLTAALVLKDPVVSANAAGGLAHAGPAAKPASGALTKLLDHADPETAKWAARALAAIDPAAAFGHARREVRLQAVAAHSDVGVARKPKSVFESLFAALADEDPDVRSLAANAIGNTYLFGRDAKWLPETGPRVLATLRKAVEKDESAVMREWAVYALGCLAPFDEGALAKDALPVLLAAAKDDAPSVRCAAFQAFRRLGKRAKESVPLLLRALGDPDRQVRSVAALTLGAVAEPTDEVVDGLAETLESWDRDPRKYAAMSLSAFGPAAKRALPALLACLEEHDDFQTRAQVAHALAEIGPDAKAAEPKLRAIFLAKERSPTEVAFALCRLGSPVTAAALERLLEVGMSDVGGGARSFLGRLGATARPVIPALIRHVEGDNPVRRRDAAYVLGDLGAVAKDAVPALEKAAESENEEVRAAAKAALEKIRGK